MVDVKDEGIDLEAAIDEQINESNLRARTGLVELLEEAMRGEQVQVINSPSRASISLKTTRGSTVTFTSVGSGARLEVSIEYGMRAVTI